MAGGGCKGVVQRNADDIKSGLFWKAVFAELLGTLILVFTGCAACLDDWQAGGKSTTVQISLTFGLAVATAVWCIAHVSGGHINPAVTCAMLITRKITVIKAILYVAAQCIGAIIGAAILHGLHPSDKHGDSLGNTTVQAPLKPVKAWGIELMITFVLVFTVFASCDKRRTDLGGSIPLTIGFSVTLCHLFAIKYTGSSMNPARSFGPAVVAGVWTDHWVYWAGPILGGIIAGLLYELIFSVDASLTKIKNLMSPDGHDCSYELTPFDDKLAGEKRGGGGRGQSDARV